MAQVAESRAFKLETLDIVHCKPTTVDLFHTVLHDKVFERLIDVTT
jgi:hypothetical protein